VAWLGLVAVIGLLVCGVTALYDFRRGRKQRKLPPGEVLPPSWWTGPHTAMVVGGGVVLIAVAIGVLLLVFGSGTTTNPAKLVTVPTTAPITTTTTSSSTTSTTLGPARPPQQVRVDVLNASAVPRAATTRASALAALGYRVTSTGNALAVQPGTVVECKAGFAAEAVALARAVGPGTLVQGFPVTPPPGSANADCVVVLGQ
jgi:LytR cell envelope-related transcriptional attenuator